MAAMVTTIAGSVGALTWLALEYHHTKKYSVLAMCTGAITGLVVITPASGYVAPWAAVAISVSGIIVVYYLLQLKMKSPRLNAFYDDTLDAFGIHGVGGVYGNIMTGVFHQRWVSDLDGEVTAGGIFDGNWVNLAQQLIGSLTIAAYSFVVTYAILYAINRIPGMKLRCSECEEAQGNDFVELGEEAYTFFEGSSLPSAVRSAKENNHDVPLQVRD